MTTRERLSATVRAELLAAGRAAVAEGRAPNMSAWVDAALARQAEYDRQLKALDEFIRSYEAEFGEITPDDVREARRYFRGRTVTVRGRTGRGSPRRKRRTA
jgi:hypothetical protein